VNQDTPEAKDKEQDMQRNDLGTQYEITNADRDVIADVITVWA